MPENPSKAFRDFLFKRSQYLYQLENGAIKDMIEPYKAARKEISDRLKKLQDYATGYTLDFRIQRLESQLGEIDGLLRSAALDSAGRLQSTISSFVVSDADAYSAMLSKQFGKIKVDIVSLPYAQIDYIMNKPLYGEVLEDKLLWANEEMKRKLKNSLTQSIIQGEDMQRATARLIDPIRGRGVIDKFVKNKAKLVARSEIQYVSNQVARSIYRQNQDVLQGVQYSSSLDNRTCFICSASDGNIFYYGKEGEDHNGPSIPRHPLCRCCYVPVTKSWSQLEKEERVKPGVSLDAKGAFTGDALDVITYNQWLKTLTTDEQINILGPGRYKLWDEGKITISDMVKNGKVLTIEQLEQKTGKLLGKLKAELPSETEFKVFNFKNKKEFEKWAKDKTDLWLKKLLPREEQAINFYKEEGFEVVNQYLRYGVDPTKWYRDVMRSSMSPTAIKKEIKEIVSDLSNALSKFNLDRDLIVYRSTKGIRYLKDIKVGDIFTDKGFVSTSPFEKQTYKFFFDIKNPIMTEIRVPKGISGAYIEGYESEFLINKGYKYRVLSKEIIDIEGKKVTKYVFEIIDDKKFTSALPTVEKVGKYTLGEMTPGKFGQSAEDILKGYKDSANATTIKGKTAEQLKKDISERLGKKMLDLKSKEWIDYIKTQVNLDFKRINDLKYMQERSSTTVNYLIQQWTVTSGDTNARSIMMQLAARTEFGLKGTNIWWEKKVLKEAEVLFKEHGNAARQFLRVMYNDTQEHLAKQGLKTVRIVRGYKGVVKGVKESTIENPIAEAKIRLQPMSSFTSDINVTSDFVHILDDKAIFYSEVPINRILSCPVTGFGCKKEFEYVILGAQKSGGEKILVSFIKKTGLSDQKLFEDILAPKGYKTWKDVEKSLSEKISAKLKTLKTKKLPAELSAEIRANMTTRQLKAIDSYVPSDLKSRTIAELTERDLAVKLGAEHIIGKRPFDVFLDNEFIEVKTFVQGRGQVRMRPASKLKKTEFVEKYKVRAHTVVVDKRPDSETYGKIFYRKGLGDWTPSSMTEVKDYAHLKELLKQGARKEEVAIEPVTVKLPSFNLNKEIEKWFVDKYKFKEVDFAGIELKTSKELARGISESIETLSVRPKGVKFLDDFKKFNGGLKNSTAAEVGEDGVIYFNKSFFKNIDYLKDMSKFHFETGHFTTASPMHIVRHEIGHLKYFKIGGTEKTAARKLSPKLVKNIGPENVAKYISKYGLKNEGEFYAEMLAKRMAGEKLHPIAARYIKDIEKGLKRNIKSKSVSSSKTLKMKIIKKG